MHGLFINESYLEFIYKGMLMFGMQLEMKLSIDFHLIHLPQ